ncbi:MAG: protein-disulfide reductase DsbD [Methylotenera sp.]|nr:protein-disulfide reductase DsbD [Methylotenera sp.]
MIKRLLLLLCLLSPTLYAEPNASAEPLSVTENNSAEFLEPEQAFKLDLTSVDANTIKASFKVAPGHYLYRKRMSLSLSDEALGSIETTFPKGEIKQDPNFGESEVYHHDTEVIAKVSYAKAAPTTLDVVAKYQGCSEKGLCYSPITKTITLDLATGLSHIKTDGDSMIASNAAAVSPTETLQSSTDNTASNTGNGDEVNSLLKGGNLWLIVLGFFGFGLLLSLTPCVFPMIPILSGIIVGQGTTTKIHSFNLSVAYTLGMAVSYTLAGIAAGLSGHLISAALQNPWVLGSSALVFVLLALSMFGFYELQLPSSMESSVLNFTNKIKGGKFLSVFVMGVLSALIVSPCVAAPLAGALLYIGQTHDVVLGGLALFSLSLGMGVPLLIVGASAGALLPKAGNWMVAVRNFFGVMMLGMAIYLISAVIPVSVQMLLWAALLITASIYMHALDPLPANKTNWSKFWKGIGVITLLLGISQFLGAMLGSTNPLQPLAGIRSVEAKEASTELHFKRVANVAELDAAIAGAEGKYVMLDFYADWCTSCKEYERLTFKDPKVQARLSEVILLQADVTKNTAEDSAMLKRFKLFGPPGIIFFDKTGKELSANTVLGYQEAEQFIESLNKALL